MPEVTGNAKQVKSWAFGNTLSATGKGGDTRVCQSGVLTDPERGLGGTGKTLRGQNLPCRGRDLPQNDWKAVEKPSYWGGGAVGELAVRSMGRVARRGPRARAKQKKREANPAKVCEF